MERLVLHPQHSNNPLYRPVVIDAKDGCDVVDYAACTLTAEEDMEVEIIIQTREPNGTIYLEGRDLRRRMVHRQQGMMDIVEDRATRPVLLVPTLPDEFGNTLQEADEIDISSLYWRGRFKKRSSEATVQQQANPADGEQGGNSNG